MKDIICIVLAGGKGTRLYPLTKYRSKPAVPIGGKYRLIDVSLSNCLHAGFYRIFVLTQYSSESLNRHIATTYRFDDFSGGYVDILAAEQTFKEKKWYLGTADAVRHNILQFGSIDAEDILIISGDHLYRMDMRAFLRCHKRTKADITIAVKPVPVKQAEQFGILTTDKKGNIISFKEKPSPHECHPQQDKVLASMGIYLFKKKVLIDILLKYKHMQDFGRDIIPAVIEHYAVKSYNYHGFWADVGTIRSYYECNLSLTDDNPKFNFYDAQAPIYTHPRFLPASVVKEVKATSSIIADGCMINKANLVHSVIGLRSIIDAHVSIEHSLIMGADYYEDKAMIRENKRKGIPNIGVGAYSSIKNAIIDKNARIGKNVTICNKMGKDHYEADNYAIVDGIVVIEKKAIIPDGTVI